MTTVDGNKQETSVSETKEFAIDCTYTIPNDFKATVHLYLNDDEQKEDKYDVQHNDGEKIYIRRVAHYLDSGTYTCNVMYTETGDSGRNVTIPGSSAKVTVTDGEPLNM